MTKAIKRDYYQVLNIDSDSSQDEVKSAFRKLAMKYHPDHNKKANAAKLFQEINEAYQVLGDVEKRRKYDETYIPGCKTMGINNDLYECPSCGALIPFTANRCPFCGSKILWSVETKESKALAIWSIITAIICPPLGIVLGIYGSGKYISKVYTRNCQLAVIVAFAIIACALIIGIGCHFIFS